LIQKTFFIIVNLRGQTMIEILKSPLSQIELEELFPSSLQNLLQELAFEFEGDRQQLLSNRSERQKAYDLGKTPHYEYDHVAKVSDWKVAPIPKDLQDRRVEITGPINRGNLRLWL
jgi:malate synthase